MDRLKVLSKSYSKNYEFWQLLKPLISIFDQDRREPRFIVIVLFIFTIARFKAITEVFLNDKPLVQYTDHIMYTVVLMEGLFNWFCIFKIKRQLINFIADLEQACEAATDRRLMESTFKSCFFFNTGTAVLCMIGAFFVIVLEPLEYGITAFWNGDMPASNIQQGMWLPFLSSEACWMISLIDVFIIYKAGALRACVLLTLACSLKLLAATFSALQNDIRVPGACASVGKLRFLVQRHQILLELAARLNIAYKQLMIPVTVLTFILCCFMLFIISTKGEDLLHNVPGLMIGILLQYCYCWHGQLLSETSAGVADSAAEVDWANISPECRRMLQLMMLRAQRPCCVTAKNFLPANLITFLKMIKTMFSLVSCLLVITSR